MSNIVLNMVAQKEAEKAVEQLVEVYNNPDLTMKGKKEALQYAFFGVFLKGYNLREAMGNKEN